MWVCPSCHEHNYEYDEPCAECGAERDRDNDSYQEMLEQELTKLPEERVRVTGTGIGLIRRERVSTTYEAAARSWFDVHGNFVLLYHGQRLEISRSELLAQGDVENMRKHIQNRVMERFGYCPDIRAF